MFNSLLCQWLVVRNWEQAFVTSLLIGRREQEISDRQSTCFGFSYQFFKFVFLVVNQNSMALWILKLIPFFKRTIFSKSRRASFVVITLICPRSGGTFRIIIFKIVLFFRLILIFILLLLFTAFNSVLLGWIREEHSFEDVDHREIKGTPLILKYKFQNL